MNNYEFIYPNVTDCFQLEKQINIIKNDIDYYYMNLNDAEANRRKAVLDQKIQLYNLLKCPKIVADKRAADYNVILEKYSNIAKERIESQTFSTRNVLILISAITVGVTLYMVIKKGKK